MPCPARSGCCPFAYRPAARPAARLPCRASRSCFPEIDARDCPLGVFGVAVADDHCLQEGDRLEIYRPLENDPLETRRRLARQMP